MKIWYLLLLTAVFSFLLFVFLGVQTGAQPLSAPVLPDPIQIILKSNEQNPMDFWDVVVRGVQDAAKEYSVQFEISGPSHESQVHAQIDILEDIIATTPPLIIIAAGDFELLAGPIKAAAEKNIPVIVFDSAVNSNVPSSFIATDNIAAGIKAGEKLKQLLENSGNKEIAIVSHIQGTATAIDREAGVRQALSGEHIIGTWFCDVDEDKAYEITMELLENPNLGGIVALNEAATLGVARAIEEKHAAGRVQTVGFDNAARELMYLEQGILQATIVQRPYNMGYMAVKTAVETLNGVSVDDFIDTGSVLITKENMFQKEFQELLFPFPPQ